MVEWETGETTIESLYIIASHYPVTCAVYSNYIHVLQQEGWKRFQSIARHQNNLLCLVKQSKLRSYHTSLIKIWVSSNQGLLVIYGYVKMAWKHLMELLY